MMTVSRLDSDLLHGVENLRLHKLRTLLTMLGMIFGVAAVVSMLSIGAGAQQQMMAFIEQLGVRNLIVEAKEATNYQDLQKVRKISPGLTFRDWRVIKANIDGIDRTSPRKRFTPSKMLPKPQRDMPVAYGVEPNYLRIAGLQVVEGRWFDADENGHAAPVCVLGDAARAALYGNGEPLGQYLKVDEQWLHVVGVVAPQLTVQGAASGLPSQDLNNLIYVPLYTALDRLEDTYSDLKDDIDGIYLQMRPGVDVLSTADVVRGILNNTHGGAKDFSVVAPAELLAEQKRTQRIFEMVMVAIASISLLVGGIGIMNIMLAGILERTREIGVRRAVGARRVDIVRQFLVEATLISIVGGLIGIVFGFGMSRVIALLAGWSTIVTLSSILLAFLVSVTVGLIFGTYPAVKAARLDPAEAIRYE
ncbi:MAG: ABC transporter permease [Terriglobia bacterium]|jgi:putative ABC transport system permease protein